MTLEKRINLSIGFVGLVAIAGLGFALGGVYQANKQTRYLKDKCLQEKVKFISYEKVVSETLYLDKSQYETKVEVLKTFYFDVVKQCNEYSAEKEILKNHMSKVGY